MVTKDVLFDYAAGAVSGKNINVCDKCIASYVEMKCLVRYI